MTDCPKCGDGSACGSLSTRPDCPDPVRANQSKYVGADGRLRYSADGSEVYPGPTGVRRYPNQLGDVEEII